MEEIETSDNGWQVDGKVEENGDAKEVRLQRESEETQGEDVGVKIGARDRGNLASGRGGFFASHLQSGMRGKKTKVVGGNHHVAHHKHGQGGAVGAVGAQQYALKDNSEMLKSINTNKM